MNRIRLASFSFLLLGAVALLSLACAGDTQITTTSTQTAGISANGTGRVYGSPDVVTLRLGVTVEMSSVAQAREAAANAMQGVIDSLKRNGVDDEDIQTVQFTVSPQYDFGGRVQTLRGYRVDNVVSAAIHEIGTAGKAIDDAAAAGGNAVVVQSISFGMDDPTELQKQARELAVAQARERAGELADHAGVGLGKLLSISEDMQFVSPPDRFAISTPRTGDVATPIEAGELAVVVNVTLLYGID
jgi:uncharacterized protein YggE